MKTVGIITTFRQSNWGSVLQAYALQRVISQLGFDVELIDYKYPNQFHWERGCDWGKEPSKTLGWYLRELKALILNLLGFRSAPKMKVLNDFIEKNIKVSRLFNNHADLHSNPPKYDVYVTGSDQVWNPNTMLGDLSYMLDFAPEGSYKISYASSFSCLSIPEPLKANYQKYLSLYTALSVRENNGKKVIKELIDIDVDVVVDPTLLLTGEEWSVLAKSAKTSKLPEKYILCYMLSYTYDADEPMATLLQKVQEKYQMPVIALRTMPKSFHGYEFKLPRSYNKGVPEFLYLIKNASIVVSSSFHGTAFSLNFGKPIIALAADNEDDRVYSLMKNINLLSNYVDKDTISKSDLVPFYDCGIEENLKVLREQSMNYLKQALTALKFK